MSKQAVSQAIDVLVKRGYVDRSPDPSDRRRITLELTERGHQVVAAVWRGTEAIDSQLRQGCRPKGWKAMRSGLMALADIKAEATASGAGLSRPSRRHGEFRQVSPIFPVRDLAAALRHYATLGCKTFAYDGGGYGFANRDRLSIHLPVPGAP